MAVDHIPGDGEAEPGSRAGVTLAPEGLEALLAIRLVDAAPAVDDLDDAVFLGAHHDCAALEFDGQGVVEKIADDAFDRPAVAAREHRLRRRLELDPAIGFDGEGRVVGDNLGNRLDDVDLSVEWGLPFARAIERSVYGQDLIDLNENWRILLGGN